MLAFFFAISLATIIELVRHRREKRRGRGPPRRPPPTPTLPRARRCSRCRPRARAAREVPRPREEHDQGEEAVQAIDQRLVLRIAEERELRDGEDEERDGEPDRSPVAPPRPDGADHDQQLPDVHDHREAAMRIDPLLVEVRPHVRGDREGLDQHADDDDCAADEHEPQRCSSHARDHTTPTGRIEGPARVEQSVNRLAESSSPYLLQHASNPVDWYPWGDEAFARARQDGRPLLVSVGYSSCHWCHVMEHESFSQQATAELMNELFVNVKVDREERPDVDALTMEACVTMTGQGGWPTTVFLTPEGRPFYAGTYFPPEPRHGLPSFRQLLAAVADAWNEQRDDVEPRPSGSSGAGRRSRARGDGRDARARPARPRRARPRAGVRARLRRLRHGAEVPPASALELLLRRGTPEALGMVTRTLDGMAAGGLYDVVGGGFHRYSVDALGRAALREDALRQRAPHLDVSPRLARHRGGPLSDGRRGDGRVPAARDAPARRRLRVGAGCGHRRRRG